MPETVPISALTGEPARVWSVWGSAALFLAAVPVLAVSVGVCFWTAVEDFNGAAWIFRIANPQELHWKVLLVVALTFSVVVIGAFLGVTGFYAWQGYSWTRWSGLIAVALAAAAILINPVAWAVPIMAAVGEILLWLPATKRYFDTWRVRRHPEDNFEAVQARVVYGPVPRYRWAK
ncbi:MAG: hypothetical protein LBR21_09480 [Propionibacteriaceae bacterium]|jgi:hypothetical protein|nr:hypothetical protein [Propionibacteriaceae bacterium]